MEAYHRKDWEGAVEAFRRVLEVHPGFTLAHLLIGEVHLRLGRQDKAEEEWQRANEKNGPIRHHAFVGMAGAGLKTEGVTYLDSIVTKKWESRNLPF